VKSLGGKEYFVLFLDDKSDEVTVEMMVHKSETLKRYKHFVAWAKRQRGVKTIGEFQCDRGGEFMSNEFTAFLKDEGTIRRLTVHDSPPQNGKSERQMRTLVEHTRATLLDAGAPKFLWAECLAHVVYIRNRTTTKNTPGSTPHEIATGEKPNLSALPRWYSEVWVMIEGAGKLEAKSKEGHWVGYDTQSKGHRICAGYSARSHFSTPSSSCTSRA